MMSTPTTPGHYVVGDRLWLRFVCAMPGTAECRNGCGEHGDGCPAWLDGDECDHPKTKPLPYCNIVEWIENTGVTESAGPDETFAAVNVKWDRDGYRWTFAGEPK